MLKQILKHKTHRPSFRTGLVSLDKRGYERMTTEQYLLNTRKSQSNMYVQKAKLKPILEASKRYIPLMICSIDHGSDCNIQLIGMP